MQEEYQEEISLEVKFMVSTDMMVYDMLNSLEEDYKMAISYIQYLSDSRKKQREQKAAKIMDKFQSIIGSDKGWNSEDEMLADMAEFRKEKQGL